MCSSFIYLSLFFSFAVAIYPLCVLFLIKIYSLKSEAKYIYFFYYLFICKNVVYYLQCIYIDV